MKKLIIGTSNFFSNYGINQNYKDMKYPAIISEAIRSKITRFETSTSYKIFEHFEEVFFHYREDLEFDIKISTEEVIDAVDFREKLTSIEKTLKLFKVNSIMLHNLEILNRIEVQDFIVIINNLQKEYKIPFFGFSCYEESDLDRLEDLKIEFNTVQVPENLADQRLSGSIKLNKLANSGVVVNVRSFMLQGLLTLDFSQIPNKFSSFRKFVRDLNLLSVELKCRPIDLLLGYVKSLEWASGIVFGVNNVNQLKQIVDSNFEWKDEYFLEITKVNDFLIDPRKWYHE